MPLTDLHHVQLAMPKGQEDRARAFYEGVMGLPEVPKPATLAARGGVWFERGTLRLHLGVEEPFRPAQKAHPALVADGLDALAARIAAAGHKVQRDDDLPGFARFYTADPFGNRIEILEPLGSA